MSEKTLLLAEWVAPMDPSGPSLIHGGAVAFEEDGIIEVGEARTIRWRHPDAEVFDAGEALVLPGLVNAHTHLELSDLSRDEDRPAHFVEWIKQMRARSKSPRTDADIESATRFGIEESLRFGVTTVGDISQRPDLTRKVLSSSRLRAVSYGEVIAFGKLLEQAESVVRRASDRSHESKRVRVGISPHAPYTVDESVYRDCLALSERFGYPLATHLAESPDEAEFLADHAGPFRTLWDSIALWSAPRNKHAGGPVHYAHLLGLLHTQRTLLAHVNYCSDADLERLAQGRASVAYCPRTHEYFGHPPHRWREMLARAVNVAVGTDSRASSPDLNLVEDLRLIHRQTPEVEPHVLWSLATVRAARAIGMDSLVGTLAPGKSADLVVFPTSTDDPLREVLESGVLPALVFASGAQFMD